MPLYMYGGVCHYLVIFSYLNLKYVHEIMDKSGKREIFIAGALAEIFRANVKSLIASEPSVEDIDDFLGKYDAMMGNRVVFH